MFLTNTVAKILYKSFPLDQIEYPSILLSEGGGVESINKKTKEVISNKSIIMILYIMVLIKMVAQNMMCTYKVKFVFSKKKNWI